MKPNLLLGTLISLMKPNSLIFSPFSLTITPNLTCKCSISSIPATINHEQLLQFSILNKNLTLGKIIHSKLVIKGLQHDSFFATKLITLYSLFRLIAVSEYVFQQVSSHNVFVLNSMIRGYCSNGLHQKALNLFYKKKNEGVEPDSYTFSCLLKGCGSLMDLRQGKKIQKLAVECGLDSDLYVLNSLIAMFGKCGNILDAVKVFEEMPQRDIVSWNSIVSALVENGLGTEAMDKVRELVRRALRPDQVTIVSTLSVCNSVASVSEIHGYVLRNGLESVPAVCNSLISTYGKCGTVEVARLVFDLMLTPNEIAWNALISSYAQNGYFEKSIQLLGDMKAHGFDLDVVTYSCIVSSLAQSDRSNDAMKFFVEMLELGLKPDVITIASILPAVSNLLYFGFCKEIHGYSYRNGCESDRRVKNALIDVYTKCGSIQSAVHIFKGMKNPDVISWSSMIVGYVRNGYQSEACKSFRDMIIYQIEPNPVSITSVLSACGSIFSTLLGKELHLWALKNNFHCQTFVGSALIDMYAKCGRIGYSEKVFNMITEKNLVTWNSMIGGYGIHGLGEKAIEVFKKVKKPDQVSFITILSACNHGGLVDEGIKFFCSMKDFGVCPTQGHYTCMVDMLARSGRFSEALRLIGSMPVEVNAEIFGALLGACKIHSNLKIGICTGARLMETGPTNAGQYAMLSNILADSKMWEEVEMIRRKMEEAGLKKEAGRSWIEENKGKHAFLPRERAQSV